MKYGEKRNPRCLLVLCTVSAAVILLLVALASATSRRAPSSGDSDTDYAPLPSKFAVNWSYRVPPGNQLDRGTCWIFSSVGLLEASYRHQGILSGLLRDDEYVALSQEAIGQVMVRHCRGRSDGVCSSGKRAAGAVSSGSFEEFFSYYSEMGSFRDSVLPAASCAYQDVDDETEVQCPSLDADLRANPLSFRIAGAPVEVQRGVEQAKELLYSAQRPLLHAFPNPVNRYWVECSDALVQGSDVCTYKLRRCPGNAEKFCAPVEYHLSKPHAVDLVFHAGRDVTVGVPHATLLVGYNDDFVETLPINVTLRPPQKGGLILKNSWGNHGHSLEYLTGEITKEQEDSVCPNPDDPFGWIPVSLECMEAFRDPAKCSTDMRRNFGKNVLAGGTELVCINESHCDTSKSYALYLDPGTKLPYVRFTENGFPVARVIEFSDETEPVVREIGSLPFDHFYYAFQMKNQFNVTNDQLNCGYYFFFYDTIREVVSQLHQKTGSWRIIDLDIKWTKESYERSGAKKNYTNVRKSTYKYPKLNINDFIYVDDDDVL